MTRARAVQRLADVRAEIAQIQARLNVAHGLGDTNTAQGISFGSSNTTEWRRQLARLKAQEAWLEQKVDHCEGRGLPPKTPGVNLAIISAR